MTYTITWWWTKKKGSEVHSDSKRFEDMTKALACFFGKLEEKRHMEALGSPVIAKVTMTCE